MRFKISAIALLVSTLGFHSVGLAKHDHERSSSHGHERLKKDSTSKLEQLKDKTPGKDKKEKVKKVKDKKLGKEE